MLSTSNSSEYLPTGIPNVLQTIIIDYCQCLPVSDPWRAYDNNNIVRIQEKLRHDGYDSEGPKSDIYDQYILYKCNGNKYVAHWIREDWFSNTLDDKLYFLCKIQTFKKFMNSNNVPSRILRNFNYYLPRKKKFIDNDGFTYS